MRGLARPAAVIAAVMLWASAVRAQDADELSKQLQNPVANLISVPFQSNFEYRGGPFGKGFQWTTNIQPVVPVKLNEDWNVIVRTILPVIHRDGYGPLNATGLGDTTQSFFFTPRNAGSFVWAIGPAFLWPTATDPDLLGTGKWGAGPTALLLLQQGPWTIGFLANHIWSYAGNPSREEVNSTFLQPFLGYNFGHGFSITGNTESTYDWVRHQWTVPINLIAAQVFKIGNQSMSAGLGGKYYVVRPDGAPRWGIRAVLTFLFPT